MVQKAPQLKTFPAMIVCVVTCNRRNLLIPTSRLFIIFASGGCRNHPRIVIRVLIVIAFHYNLPSGAQPRYS